MRHIECVIPKTQAFPLVERRSAVKFFRELWVACYGVSTDLGTPCLIPIVSRHSCKRKSSTDTKVTLSIANQILLRAL